MIYSYMSAVLIVRLWQCLYRTQRYTLMYLKISYFVIIIYQYWFCLGSMPVCCSYSSVNCMSSIVVNGDVVCTKRN